MTMVRSAPWNLAAGGISSRSSPVLSPWLYGVVFGPFVRRAQAGSVDTSHTAALAKNVTKCWHSLKIDHLDAVVRVEN